jgi:hypothetical protein
MVVVHRDQHGSGLGRLAGLGGAHWQGHLAIEPAHQPVRDLGIDVLHHHHRGLQAAGCWRGADPDGEVGRAGAVLPP